MKNMNFEYDYGAIPADFAHCFHEQCTCSEQCLRHLAALAMPDERKFVTIVNPRKVVPDGQSCPFFKEKRLVRFAIGMKHLYDNLLHTEALAVRNHLYSRWGRSMYYRVRNGERPLDPEEQAYIGRVFREQGITSEPRFDSYQDDYIWI